MSNCLNCGEEVPQTEGKRERKFCDNKGKCRNEHYRKLHPEKYKKKSKEPMKCIPVSEWEKLKIKLDELNLPDGSWVSIDENGNIKDYKRNDKKDYSNNIKDLAKGKSFTDKEALDKVEIEFTPDQHTKVKKSAIKEFSKIDIPPIPIKEDYKEIDEFWKAKAEWKQKYSQ